MRILSYEYTDLGRRGWHFSKADFSLLNLLVGDTASGKTRYLNTIFNISSSIFGSRKLSGPNKVLLTFSHNGDNYEWYCRTDIDNEKKIFVLEESLVKIADGREIIYNRNPNEFTYNNIKLPKLSLNQFGISLLKDEKKIKPIHEAFGQILRRNFFSDALQDVIPVVIPTNINLDKRIRSLNELYKLTLPTNLKLFILKRDFPIIFSEILDCFTSVFSFIGAVDMKELRELLPSPNLPGPTPVLAIREKGMRNWISVDQLSSGMQKVLLIITDTLSLPDGSIYLIDEYENSLGVSAINFFPEFILNRTNNIQFIVTSHHPYLINQIHPDHWLIFSRKGSEVSIRFGQENAKIYGKSKQQWFIQLINDPFYAANDL